MNPVKASVYFLDPLDSLDYNWDCLNFYQEWGTLFWKGALILSLFSWDPGSRGKVRGQEGSEGFTPKSVPLGNKSGMSWREIKSNTYGTSTHFSYFLQNRSSCKTVIIEILQQICVPHLLKDTVAIQYHRRRSGVSFLNSGDQTCPSSFKYILKKWFWNC